MSNHYPLTRDEDEENSYFEGDWARNYSDSVKYNKPLPLPTSIQVRQKFLNKLKKIMKIANNSNVPLHKKNNIPIEFILFKGYSLCQLCNSNNLEDSEDSDDSDYYDNSHDDFGKKGWKEFEFKYKSNTYKFNGNIYHYYKFHNVQPSEEFKTAVTGFYKKYKSKINTELE